MKMPTMPRLKPNMGAQKVFDRVAIHLMKQKKQSVSTTGTCKYRHITGLKCAIGSLIPNSLYDPKIENMSVTELSACECGNASTKTYRGKIAAKTFAYLRKLCPIISDTTDFYSDLQAIHDLNQDDSWLNELIKFADRYNLSDKCLDYWRRRPL